MTEVKVCKKCNQNFSVTDDDLKFYERMSPVLNNKRYLIPSPSLCPDCRQQRRHLFRNERNLYSRKCDLCGKQIISMYRQDLPYKVYCLDCFWGDKWDPLDYGKDYDFNRPFFEQFDELVKVAPHMCLIQWQTENSLYTNNVSCLKDCYLCFSSDFNQDCLYSIWIEKSRNIVESLIITSSELSYKSFFAKDIYNCIFALYSSVCRDCSFIFDCKNCYDCFMCYGLRNKRYCIGNVSYSREEYLEKMKSYPLSSYKAFNEMKKYFLEEIKKTRYLYMKRNGRIFDSIGDLLTDTMNCNYCFELSNAKDCKYVQSGYELKDSMDCCYVMGEMGYENCECFPMPFKSAFNLNVYTGSDVYYSNLCMNNCRNIFGCASLKHGEYCILNKKYSKEEYEKLVPKIIKSMQASSEWGEFFPYELSEFDYNETVAQECFPLTKEEAFKNGFRWHDPDKKEYKKQTYEIPDDIKDVKDNIVNAVLACEVCGKNYKIIEPELRFYRRMKVPVPRKCFECRYAELAAFKNPRKFYERKCVKCEAELLSTYSSDKIPEVYCEKCYEKEVY